jgi:hypothetical protein
MSSATPWQSEGRFVTGPWNHLDAARERLRFPDAVRFHDVALRDGQQQAGVAFTPEDKLAITRRLAQAGMNRIEAWMPIVSQDEAGVRAIADGKIPPVRREPRKRS